MNLTEAQLKFLQAIRGDDTVLVGGAGDGINQTCKDICAALGAEEFDKACLLMHDLHAKAMLLTKGIESLAHSYRRILLNPDPGPAPESIFPTKPDKLLS